jgi:hypothetical protein
MTAQDGRWNRIPCMTTSRYKTVPSGTLHFAAVKTSTPEDRRRALSRAGDPKRSPLVTRHVEQRPP